MPLLGPVRSGLSLSSERAPAVGFPVFSLHCAPVYRHEPRPRPALALPTLRPRRAAIGQRLALANTALLLHAKPRPPQHRLASSSVFLIFSSGCITKCNALLNSDWFNNSIFTLHYCFCHRVAKKKHQHQSSDWLVVQFLLFQFLQVLQPKVTPPSTLIGQLQYLPWLQW